MANGVINIDGDTGIATSAIAIDGNGMVAVSGGTSTISIQFRLPGGEWETQSEVSLPGTYTFIGGGLEWRAVCLVGNYIDSTDVLLRGAI